MLKPSNYIYFYLKSVDFLISPIGHVCEPVMSAKPSYIKNRMAILSFSPTIFNIYLLDFKNGTIFAPDSGTRKHDPSLHRASAYAIRKTKTKGHLNRY